MDPENAEVQTEVTDAPAGSAVPAAAATPDPAPAVERPEWIPEKFWDAEAKSPRIEDLAKSYRKLESIHGSAEKFEETIRTKIEEERRAALPPAPEEYKPVVPAELVPEGASGEINTDDPLVKFWQQTAHKYGLTPEDFNAGIAEFLKADIAAHASIKDEVKKLGENAEARVKAVDNWLVQALDKEAYSALARAPLNADYIRALEVLMEKAGASVPANDDPSATPAGATMTLEELKELQKDPRYWKYGEKDIVAKVEAGYKQLFPKKAK